MSLSPCRFGLKRSRNGAFAGALGTMPKGTTTVGYPGLAAGDAQNAEHERDYEKVAQTGTAGRVHPGVEL